MDKRFNLNKPNIHDAGVRVSMPKILENNRDINRVNSGEYKRVLPPLYRNDFRGFYQYNGFKGQLRYSKDTSVKSDPITLDRWGNEYEEGRRTLLYDVANKYGVKVSGYNLPNSDVKLKGNNKTPPLNVVGFGR